MEFVIFLDLFWALKMEARSWSETLLDYQWIKWRLIQEDSPFHNHECDNFKSPKRTAATFQANKNYCEVDYDDVHETWELVHKIQNNHFNWNRYNI
jgi:hypothetical protein